MSPKIKVCLYVPGFKYKITSVIIKVNLVTVGDLEIEMKPIVSILIPWVVYLDTNI